MPVLEREKLLAQLRLHLDGAARGEGSLAFIAGEAGIGKTTLVRTFVENVGQAALVLAGACDPLATPRPLSPLLDIGANPDSGIGDLVAEGAAPYEIFAALQNRLRGTVRPTTLIVEDAHWADAATLDFIRFIGRRVRDSKALVLCTYRDDEVGADHPLQTVLGDLAPLRDRIHRIRLDTLSFAAVRELAGDRGVDVSRLYDVTGGNPFYVTEVLAGDEDIPPSVAAAVLARVNRLDREARTVVEVTSIAPRSLEVALAAELAGSDAGAAERAVRAGVLVGDGLELRFRHELARAAVESSILDARRIGLHRDFIELLERQERRDPARLAHHAHRAGDPDLVLQYAPAAAENAVARGAHREAAEYLELALAHHDRLDGEAAAALRMQLSWENYILNRPEAAVAQSEAALDYYRTASDRPGLGRALIAHSRTVWFTDPKGARALVRDALEVLEQERPGEDLAHALYSSGHMSMLARHHDAAVGDARRCLAVATEIGSERYHALGLVTLGTAELVTGDADRGIALLEEALRLPAMTEDYRLRIVALGMLGSGGGEVRRYEQALAWLAADIELGERYDEDYTIGYARAWMARIHFEQGRWDEAAAAAAAVPQEGAYINQITALGALGRVRVRRGDPGAAEVLAEARALAEHQELQHRWPIVAGLAEQAWLRGDLGPAQAAVSADYELALQTDSRWARGELGFWMWRTGAVDVPPDGAAEPFALQIAGDWRSAAASWRALACPYDEAMALADGDDEDSLRTSLDLLHRLGASPAADLVRAKMRRLGIEGVPLRPRSGAGAASAMLTRRQAEVLDLVCAGLTDAEIAQRLFISPKTAGHHVSAILRKLGVRSRTEAAAVAFKMGIASPVE